MPSSNISEFKEILKKSKCLVILTGAGVSAESGIPTFRGAGGLWRQYSAMDLASPEAWQRDPGLVWEFYNYRRQIMGDKKPNPAHFAIAEVEKDFLSQEKSFYLITQNIDDLHFAAGSKNGTRLHGSLWMVRCCKCQEVTANRQVPITSAYEGSGSPDPKRTVKKFREKDLPHCQKCKGILRPHVVWFGESLDPEDYESAMKAMDYCDVFIVIGTSAMVYPAASFASIVKRKNAVVAEVNLEETPATSECDFFFHGKAGEILPGLLKL